MDKSDKDHARQLLDMANMDHSALSHMLDSASFSDEVFGFHAQQTIEKALKAWIAVRGLVYPKSHDVSALVKILRDDGQDLGKFPNLEDYTVFAVQYRYEAYDSEDDIDRDEAIEKRERSWLTFKEFWTQLARAPDGSRGRAARRQEVSACGGLGAKRRNPPQ